MTAAETAAAARACEHGQCEHGHCAQTCETAEQKAARHAKIRAALTAGLDAGMKDPEYDVETGVVTEAATGRAIHDVTALATAAATGSCIFCGTATKPGAATGSVGEVTGPMCADCAYWADGNVKTEASDPMFFTEQGARRPVTMRGGFDPDGYDRSGAFDGFQVVSDADPGL